LVPNAMDAVEGFLFPSFGEAYDPAFGLEGDTVVFNTISDQYEHYLEYANKLYSEKLLEQEVYTLKAEQVSAKVKENLCGVMTFGTQLTADNFASGKYEVELFPPLTSEYTQTRKLRKYNSVNTGYAVMTTKNQYPEATARWLDMNYSEEEVVPGVNRLSVWLGLKGETWDYTSDDKSTYQRIIPADTKLSEVEYMTTYVSPGWGPCALILSAIPSNSLSQSMKATQSLENLYPYMKDRFPDTYLKYTTEEMEAITNKWTDINTYVTQMKAKFVTGQEPLANWDKFVAQVKQMGIDDVLKSKQSAYDRMFAE